VVPIEKGRAMGDMLASGELAAAIGVDVNAPDVKPLIPHGLEAGLAALRQRGHYPINHTVVIKDELIAKHGDLAADVFDAFARATAPPRRAAPSRARGARMASGQGRAGPRTRRRATRRPGGSGRSPASRSPTASRRTAPSSRSSSGTL